MPECVDRRTGNEIAALRLCSLPILVSQGATQKTDRSGRYPRYHGKSQTLDEGEGHGFKSTRQPSPWTLFLRVEACEHPVEQRLQ